MTQDERIEKLEAEVAELRKVLGLPGTDDSDLQEAIKMIVENKDSAGLAAYLNRGGKIPINGH
jgi:hypothetical protein